MLCIEINLRALKSNVEYLKSQTKADICGVVKANAYGHGLITIAKELSSLVNCFAVADYNEAKILYNSKVKNDIIILGNSEIDEPVPNNIIPTIVDMDDLKKLYGKAKRINIKINTGMNRLGCSSQDFKSLFQKAQALNFEVYSVFSHFSNPSDKDFTSLQYKTFINATNFLPKEVKRHISASNFLHNNYHLDMVRCGLAMYGYGNNNLIPVMKVYSSITQITSIKKGEHVGYGNFKATRDMTIACARIGYGDGYRRKRLPRYVSINGKKALIVGQICMDMLMIDVSDIPCKKGDRVYVLGELITGTELALSCDTIIYEVLCGFKRGTRIYIE